MPKGNRSERRYKGGRPHALRPTYTTAHALQDARKGLGNERPWVPLMAARRLVATVEAWERELWDLRADKERYEGLVSEWNIVCAATEAIGIELHSFDGTTWHWSYAGSGGEAATAGQAIADALRATAGLVEVALTERDREE